MARLFSFPRERIRVVLLEGIHPGAQAYLVEHGYTNVELVEGSLPKAELAAMLADAHIVGIRSRTMMDKELLAKAPKLVALGCFCIGTNQVSLDEAARLGVPVFNAPHSNTRSVAELVIGLVVMLRRDIFRKSAEVHAGRWPKTAKGSHELRGQTLGIVGYGHIGSQVSVLAEALGMRVIFFDIQPKLPLGNAQPVASLEDLLRHADIVSLHVPETADTIGMMNEERLHAMRPGSLLVNTSRGSVVDQDALARALDRGHLAGAAVDVFPKEPRGADEPLQSPLRGRRDVILTPHLAGSTVEAQEQIGLAVAGKLMAYSDRGAKVGAVSSPELNRAPHHGTHRILHIHRNEPGMLQQINKAVADENINVLAQHLETRGPIGYVVLDIEKQASSRLFALLKEIPGTVRARILY